MIPAAQPVRERSRAGDVAEGPEPQSGGLEVAALDPDFDVGADGDPKLGEPLVASALALPVKFSAFEGVQAAKLRALASTHDAERLELCSLSPRDRKLPIVRRKQMRNNGVAMLILNPAMLIAVAAIITSLSTFVWAVRRKP